MSVRRFLMGIPLALALGFAAQVLLSPQVLAQGGPGYGPGWGQGYGSCGCPYCGQGMGPGMGYGMGPGMGQGMGPGMGYGMGPGMGYGMGRGMHSALVDRDRDGNVSADEASAWHDGVLTAMDVDDDGSLTSREFAAGPMGRGMGTGPRAEARLQRREARFRKMDGDDDGVVTHAEFLDAHAGRFETADRDGDGRVSVWEFRASRRW
jgi:hypothetical protein